MSFIVDSKQEKEPIAVIPEGCGPESRTSDGGFSRFPGILTNVARHSKAGKVWVHLDVQDGMLVLGVKDDGVGISPESGSLSRSGCSACESAPRSLADRSKLRGFLAKERRSLCVCQFNEPIHGLCRSSPFGDFLGRCFRFVKIFEPRNNAI